MYTLGSIDPEGQKPKLKIARMAVSLVCRCQTENCLSIKWHWYAGLWSKFVGKETCLPGNRQWQKKCCCSLLLLLLSYKQNCNNTGEYTPLNVQLVLSSADVHVHVQWRQSTMRLDLKVSRTQYAFPRCTATEISWRRKAVERGSCVDAAIRRPDSMT